MFTASFLNKVRQEALRKRVWYRVLNPVERGIINLTGRLIDTVQSESLGTVLVNILAKLKKSFKSSFVRHIESYGLRKALEVALQAYKFGYEKALTWAKDQNFIKFLTSQDYYKPIGWGLPV